MPSILHVCVEWPLLSAVRGYRAILSKLVFEKRCKMKKDVFDTVVVSIILSVMVAGGSFGLIASVVLIVLVLIGLI